MSRLDRLIAELCPDGVEYRPLGACLVRNMRPEGELGGGATHKEFLSVLRRGSRDVRRTLAPHNLDAVMSYAEVPQ